eukprot:ctg_1139.g387
MEGVLNVWNRRVGSYPESSLTAGKSKKHPPSHALILPLVRASMRHRVPPLDLGRLGIPAPGSSRSRPTRKHETHGS